MSLSPEDARKYLGHARFTPYRDECDGDAEALAMYGWNARIAASFWLDLGLLEVVLRNVIDQRLVARHSRRGVAGDWLDDPTVELGRDLRQLRRPQHRRPYQDIHAARGRVSNNRKPINRDQVISETSFGLWHQLVSSRQRVLWPDIAGAFPYAPGRAQRTISDPVDKLRHFRNRIAHHHRIWALNCEGHHAELLRLAGYVHPDVRDWIHASSTVSTLLASRLS
jgi:hypothetical protein